MVNTKQGFVNLLNSNVLVVVSNYMIAKVMIITNNNTAQQSHYSVMPVNISLLKFNYRNARTVWDISSKLTINTPE